uniref:Chitin-binding type-2 domain-containing protein n=1 Tax=Phragmatopoma lapidosa TaxID=341668 RepID=A0A0A0R233_9ANNE|nr:hypothetical protein [Phragmatopoma lapidosa]
MTAFLLLVTFILGTNGQPDLLCRDEAGTPVPDGHYGIGCRSYTVCTNGAGTQVDCDPDEAYNHFLTPPGCGPIGAIPPPCGIIRDCSSLTDDSYPIFDNSEIDGYVPCKHFYTCLDSEDLGAQACPGDLIFNYYTQNCQNEWQVPTPCGSGGDPPTTVAYVLD